MLEKSPTRGKTPNEESAPPTILRWAGSKRFLLPLLLDTAKSTNFSNYMEPFAGAATLYFALRPKHSVISDINEELINFYRVLRTRPAELRNSALQWPIEPRTYYYLRSLRPKTLNPLHRAARFVYLNRNSFNGVYRTNKKGEFNVPWGLKTGGIPSLRAFNFQAETLCDTEILCTDYTDVIGRATAGTLVYLDPPYDYSGRRQRGEYGVDSFKASDLERLTSEINQLDAIGAKFLLSYKNVNDIMPLASSYRVRHVVVPRRIASRLSSRNPVEEVLISNF